MQPNSNQFTVDLDVFSGPFDLLLNLIDKQKVDLLEVSISQITKDFIAYIKARKEIELSISSEFLVVASYLIELKSNRILGVNRLDGNEQEIDDNFSEADLLFSRLLQYKAFKSVAAEFSLSLAKASLSVKKGDISEFINANNKKDLASRANLVNIGVSVKDFCKLYNDLISIELEHRKNLNEYVPKPKVDIVFERKIVQSVLKKNNGKCSFIDLIQGVNQKPENIVARFLIILDMYKRNLIELNQKKSFGSLLIETKASI